MRTSFRWHTASRRACRIWTATVVEYVQRLDASFKIRGGERKWLHRRVCEKFLPRAILKRKKRGFAVNVVDEWFNASVKGK